MGNKISTMTWMKKGGSKISRQQAMEMIDGFHKENKDHVRSIYYDSEMMQSLLNTPRCAGVSIYFAKNEKETTLILVPVDETGQAIWEDDAARGGYSALDVGSPCPPYCR